MNEQMALGSSNYVTWVVGRGLIGSPMHSAAEHAFSSSRINWQAASLNDQFQSDAQRFREFAGVRPWAVVWSAGRGVVGTSATELAKESQALTAFLTAIAKHKPSGRGVFVGISSAGAIYAKSTNPPFNEATEPAPASDYGEAKLEQEQIIASNAKNLGASSLILRTANVYGCGQDMQKAQGLISHLCRTATTRQSTNLYVSPDTMRHYIYNLDLAQLVHRAISRTVGNLSPSNIVKIAASDQSVTVGELVSLVQRVSKVPMRVGFGSDSRASAQARDLRLRSRVWPELDDCLDTPLVVGVKNVLDSFRFPAALAA
jgi:UDP-glucose 4-epimerase